MGPPAARPPETFFKRNFVELNEAHKKALERLTNQERDHQILVKKLKDRITELELSAAPRLTGAGRITSDYEYFSDECSSLRLALSSRTFERDLARKTLDEVRALLNGQKL